MKFQQMLNRPIFLQLQALAKKRGIDVQEYLRAVVIPEHLDLHPNLSSKKRSEAMKKSWETRRRNQEKAELAAKNEEFPSYPAGPTQ